jgi:hypothetical protein
MAPAAVSRGSRRFVVLGVAFLVAWQVATLAGARRSTLALLGVHGFVVHVVLGKATALVPSYFDRDLAVPGIARATLPATALGAAALAGWTEGWLSDSTGVAGAVLWALGVVGTLAVLAWTVRDNLSGGETGTGDANADRRPVDRAANAVVPVAGLYLLAGAYETVAVVADLPPLAGHHLPGAVHLLAAGGALLALFGVGFRLLPRFLVASPPRPLVWVVLASGALAPVLLVAGFGGGPLFRAGAALEATAVVGFAAAYTVLYARSDSSRVGFHAVLAAVLSGVAGVAVGLAFAFHALVPTPTTVLAHLRLNVLGLLGLSIVGVTYQFYPPTVGAFPFSTDRAALASILALAGGLWLEAAGWLVGVAQIWRAGAALGLAGAGLFAYLVASALASRH